MRQINLLLLCGGGSSEHNISLLSAGYIEKTLLERSNYNLLWLELTAEGQYKTKQGEICQLTNNRQVVFENSHKAPWNIDYVLPCIHGFPGETGDIQSYFELIKLPYLGCGPEASINCFNKVTAKMWFSALGIPNTPYIFLDSLNDEAIEQTRNALNNWGSVFVKACSQGSSIGCYCLDNADDIAGTLQKAFEFSPYLVIEKTIQARELEVAVFEHQGEVIATLPGEIVCAKNTFYSFDEKYDTSSQAVTHIVAKNLDDAISAQIRQYAIKAFKGMKLKDLSRIDFFLTDNNEILLNEINTFPGLTPISMFPKMLINHGLDFGDWLSTSIEKQLG